MKTSSPGGLQDRQEDIPSRRYPKSYSLEDLLVRRIERSPRGYLLKAISKIYYFHEDLLVWRITRLPREYLLEVTSKTFYMKTSSSGGLQDCQEDISSRQLQNRSHEDLLVGRIARSPRDYFLKATRRKLFS